MAVHQVLEIEQAATDDLKVRVSQDGHLVLRQGDAVLFVEKAYISELVGAIEKLAPTDSRQMLLDFGEAI